MSASTLADYEKHIAHAWTEPKGLVALEQPGPLAVLLDGAEYEPIDADWWEPRYDQPWRRQNARDRDAFGGEYVAGPKSPVEGPNNPNRLRRELEAAEATYARALVVVEEAEGEVKDSRERIAWLKGRLAA